MSEKKKILVTGGAGYIGAHTVVELVNAGYEPIIVDDFSNSHKSVLKGLQNLLGRKVETYEVNCNEHKKLNDVFQDAGPIAGVIHFAAYKSVSESIAAPIRYYENNVGSLIAVIQAMEKHQVSWFVFSSSCTVYGQPSVLPVTESTPFQPPASPYGFTKQVGEQLVNDQLHANGQFSAALLRYFNPIGAHPSGHIGELPLGTPDNLVPYVTQTAAGWRDKLSIYGKDYNTPDGTCIRDFIHVVDLARAHVRALQWLQGAPKLTCEVLNVGTGKGNSVWEVVECFQEVSGAPLPYEFAPRRPGDIEKIYANADKIQSLLGWTAQLSLADALRDAWNWQQKLNKPKE